MNKKKRSTLKEFQYAGKLTPAMAARGVQAAMANGTQLLTEAVLLMNNGHHCRAMVLAVLGIEEVGKTQVILHILCAKDDAERKKFWKQFRTHTSKTSVAAVPSLLSEGIRTWATFDKAYGAVETLPFVLEEWKQAALYCEAISGGQWVIPEQHVPLDKAQWVLRTGLQMVNSTSMEVYCEVRYMELWQKHACPAQGKGEATWALAMVELQKEAFAIGLINQDQLDAARHYFGAASLSTPGP